MTGLQTNTIKALLAQSDSALPTGPGGKELLEVAFYAFQESMDLLMNSQSANRMAHVSLHESMYSTMRILLMRGASPRVLIPAVSAGKFSLCGPVRCSRPIEICLAEMPFCDSELELLAEFGSKLDGVCDGKCGRDSKCCAMTSALEDSMMWSKMKDRPPVERDALASSSINRNTLRLLIEVIERPIC